jgi:hypothetical protein
VGRGEEWVRMAGRGRRSGSGSTLRGLGGGAQDFIHILEEHCANCERTGRYVEAEIAKKRLEELRVHEENRRREALRARQLAERLGVEEAHMLEFQQVRGRRGGGGVGRGGICGWEEFGVHAHQGP